MKTALLMMCLVAFVAGCAPGRPKTKTVEIADHIVLVDGVPMNEAALCDIMRKERRSHRGDFSVRVLVSPNCHFGQMEKVFDTFANAGIWVVQCAMADSTNELVRIWPCLQESVHVPWHVIRVYISGENTAITTNSDEVTASGVGSTDAIEVQFNATSDTTAREMFSSLRPSMRRLCQASAVADTNQELPSPSGFHSHS